MGETVFLKDSRLAEVTVLENSFITGFLPTAPELALKAYIYGLMRVSSRSHGDTDAAAALGCTDNDLRAAFAYWEGLGLVTLISDSPLQVRYNSIDSAVLGAAARGGAKYTELVKSLQSVLGTRQLSGAELSKIYDWIEVFGFEQEAAVLTVKHCLDEKGVKTSVNYMDAAAKKLAAQGALTAEQVRQAFSDQAVLKSGAAGLLRRWHQSRPPTEDELALYEKWTEGWGFDEDAISMACEKMTSAEKPTFGYLDTIMSEWFKGGAVTRQQVIDMRKRDDSIFEIARQAFKRAGIKSRPTSEQRLKFKEWTDVFAIGPELIYLAAELSKDRAHQYVSMRNLLDEWHNKGISSITAARSYYEAYQKNAPSSYGKKKNPALNYKQGGAYTKEELKKLGISLGEEFYTDEQ